MTAKLPHPPESSPESAPEAGARQQRIGALLRRTREARRLTVDDVATALRMRPAYIEAIEDGRREALPGPVYAVGFVRAYADYLGLDGNEAVRRFKRESQGLGRQPDLSMPLPIEETSIPGGRILLVALVLAICGYGLWYYLGSADRERQEMVAAVPPSLIADNSAPSEAKAAVREPGAAVARAAAAAPAKAPAAPATVPMAAPPASPPVSPVTTVATAAAVPAPPPDLPPCHVYGVTDGPARIVLRFSGDCWVQIRGGGPDAETGKLMHAGDVYRVPDRPGLVARVGDSETVAITVDGRAVNLPKGNSLVRNIALDPAELLSWAAPDVPDRAVLTPAAATRPADPSPSDPAALPDLPAPPHD